KEAADLVDEPLLKHADCPRRDAVLDVLAAEAEDVGLEARGRVEMRVLGADGLAGLPEDLDRADEALEIVGMDLRRGLGVDAAELLVERRGADRDELLPEGRVGLGTLEEAVGEGLVIKGGAADEEGPGAFPEAAPRVADEASGVVALRRIAEV